MPQTIETPAQKITRLSREIREDVYDPDGRKFYAACDTLLDSLRVPPVVDKDFTPRLDDAFEAANGEDPERFDADFEGQRN